MCASKDCGGMGFQDIHLFNKALLAKHSWRIIKNPQSLMARVLRGKYFHEGDFLQAKEGSNLSLTWKSILWGRTLFEEGFRWRIGNGARIYISQDKWLDRKGASAPVWVKDEWKCKRLIDLLNDHGEWKEEAVKEAFLPEDAKAILRMPRSGTSSNDAIIWNYDSKRMFTVKSAYHLVRNLNSKEKATGSDFSMASTIWKSVWNANCLPGAKIASWKILKDIIPTKTNICKKGIKLIWCAVCASLKWKELYTSFGNVSLPRRFGKIFFP